MAVILGCCAGGIFHDPAGDIKYWIKNHCVNQVNFITFDDPKNKNIEECREYAEDISVVGPLTIVTIPYENIKKITSKVYYNKHDELQARDGRANDEFKPGDRVVMKNNPSYNQKYRIQREYNSQYWYLEYYDTYYHRWTNYGSANKNSLLRTEDTEGSL